MLKKSAKNAGYLFHFSELNIRNIKKAVSEKLEKRVGKLKTCNHENG